ASTASKASLRMELPDDDEIDKELETNLERLLTDEDNDLVVDKSRSRRGSRARKAPAGASIAPVRKTSKSNKTLNADYDTFAAGNIGVEEDAIEAELEAMEFEQPHP